MESESASREQELECWLQKTVAPIYDDVVVGRGTLVTGDEVRAAIIAELETRVRV